MKKLFKDFLDRLKKWDEEAPLRQKILILVFISLFPLFLFYQFYYKERREKVNLLKEEVKKLELEIQRYSPYLNRMETLNKQIAVRREFLETVKGIFPDEREVPEVLKKITELAKRNGLEVLVFKPEKEVQKDFYNEISMRIELTGDFKNIVAFLNEVQRLPRLVVVNGIELKVTKERKLNGVVFLNTFQYTGKAIAEKPSRKEQ